MYSVQWNRIALRNSVLAALTCCYLLLAAGASQTPQARPASPGLFSTLALFSGSNGSAPLSALIEGTDGNLYGTTFGGGAYGFGTIFKVSTAGTITTLYSFCAQTNCPDGQYPSAGLIQATDGNFYGTTAWGGTYFCGSFNCGTVFKITPSGTLTTLHSFNAFDGAEPNSSLVQDKGGNLYGATNSGGPNGGGVVFKITMAGALTMLAGFCDPSNNCSGGYEPSGLVLATDGDLYGTTYNGGAYGGGLVFKITTGGKMTTIYNFCSLPGCADGGDPLGGLYQAANGTFYGTTYDSGTYTLGAVFSITAQGKLTTLHTFNGTDGAEPDAGVIQATDGNFYGTTSHGGANQWGTAFKITPSGSFTLLHSFDQTDGYYPTTPLVQATNGRLYGTTPQDYLNGSYGPGTVYALNLGFRPFVETQTASGKVGTSVVILGTNLTGASKVTFNGTSATFTVVSSSEITATVPTGATTGSVVVTTPSGTLTSNKKFRITH
jgi:uncharacterized repeat protein (TIGR03803 family)